MSFNGNRGDLWVVIAGITPDRKCVVEPAKTKTFGPYTHAQAVQETGRIVEETGLPVLVEPLRPPEAGIPDKMGRY